MSRIIYGVKWTRLDQSAEGWLPLRVEKKLLGPAEFDSREEAAYAARAEELTGTGVYLYTPAALRKI